jgi:hypothetical protein
MVSRVLGARGGRFYVNHLGEAFTASPSKYLGTIDLRGWFKDPAEGLELQPKNLPDPKHPEGLLEVQWALDAAVERGDYVTEAIMRRRLALGQVPVAK